MTALAPTVQSPAYADDEWDIVPAPERTYGHGAVSVPAVRFSPAPRRGRHAHYAWLSRAASTHFEQARAGHIVVMRAPRPPEPARMIRLRPCSPDNARGLRLVGAASGSRFNARALFEHGVIAVPCTVLLTVDGADLVGTLPEWSEDGDHA